jgi:glyoxylase-like metal-dependent hydrolase (beta-lactamase superfamily II)
VTLLDLGAIHAPLKWVFPHALEDETGWLPSNALLCRLEAETVLVDCGLGPFGDVFGLPLRHVALADALASVGCPPASVTIVVLTHLDADHAGGAVERDAGELRPSLPGARVVLSTEAGVVLAGRSAGGSEPGETIGKVLHAVGSRVDALDDGGEIVGGMRLRLAPGHRAGHACVEVGGGRERLVYLADVVHAREHVAHPEWDVLHDSDVDLALATRRRWIDELAGSGAVVACAHVDGFGRVERDADGAHWVDVVL